jgi:hypothetical protein
MLISHARQSHGLLPTILTLTALLGGAASASTDGSLTSQGEVSGDSVSGEDVKRFSIATRSRTLIVLVAILATLATLGCTRAGSSRTQARPLKPTPSTKPYVGGKPAETGPPASPFLPVESW